jgi:hypothetical protein
LGGGGGLESRTREKVKRATVLGQKNTGMIDFFSRQPAAKSL